jgi:hypothetical protein
VNLINNLEKRKCSNKLLMIGESNDKMIRKKEGEKCNEFLKVLQQ